MTGDDLCVGTTTGNDLTIVGFPAWAYTGWTSRSISMTPNIDLISGKQYAIIMRVSDSSGDYAYPYARRPGLYAGGTAYESNDSGVTWEVHTSGPNDDESDMRFNTGTDSYTPTPDAGNPYDGMSLGCNGANWKAQVFTASSDYTLSSVTLLLARTYQGTPGTITVSIRDMGPSKAITPGPGDAVTNVTLDQAALTWVDGGGADTFNVYYGTTSGNLSLVSGAQEAVSFTITGITNGSPFGYLITRYWRIDSTNDYGTTTGDEWSFTTIRLTPPGPTYQHSDYYYQLLVDEDGNWGTPPPVGVEDTDYVVVTYLPNFIKTTRRLVGIANNKVWMEDL